MEHSHRTVFVAYERLDGWIERFGGRHGNVTTDRVGSRVTLTATDHAVAEYDDVAPPARFGLVLVRRGGYAVGLVAGNALTTSKCGTRYVQGKTKAGGWSQQRYARRRANQANELVGAAAAAVQNVLGAAGALPVYGGGDRQLATQTLETSGLPLEWANRWLDVGEPRYRVLQEAVKQARSIPIELNDLA